MKSNPLNFSVDQPSSMDVDRDVSPSPSSQSSLEVKTMEDWLDFVKDEINVLDDLLNMGPHMLLSESSDVVQQRDYIIKGMLNSLTRDLGKASSKLSELEATWSQHISHRKLTVITALKTTNSKKRELCQLEEDDEATLSESR